MSVQEKKELSEKILQSQKDAQIKWEREWKAKHPNVMPRAFTEADTGAAGVKPPGTGKPSGEGRGDEVLNAFASPRGSM
eukprot:12131249-Prorocentrum_lima.AAC.1